MAKPHRWEEISPYLDQIFALDEHERPAWVAALRLQNPDLGTLLQSLLDEHRALSNENFLNENQPHPGAVAPQLGRSGQTLGPYTLRSTIGQGGMGTVWLAERTDGEIELKVAIKLLGTDRGGGHLAWRDRFLTERQLLASLNHPSIVRLMDAGHTPQGTPYLVMEYVDGVAIDAYCQKRTLREKLLLFQRVCAGVGHAHRRLIIHRDLKPSNILVDTAGDPKLLDFGIAKLADDSSDPMAAVERLHTPHYASPEQMRGAPQSTATDIYSLGAVLYKLLTGRSPHEQITGTTKPSKSLPGTRGIARPSSLLDNGLPADLDDILGKALRTEPEERYVTVEAFATDIKALLENRPVQARAATAWYRGRKFLRRHWLPVTAAALMVSGLAASLFVANRERTSAQHRFQQVRELAHTFVFDLPDELVKTGASTKVRELTVRTGVQYLDSLSKNAGDDLELQKEIAAAYMKVGDAQGFPTKPNLGRIGDALVSYRKAGELYARIAARNPAYRPDLAHYYLQYAALVRFAHDLEQARALSESAIRTFGQLRAAAPNHDAQTEAGYITAWCTLGDMDEDLGRFRQAWTEFSRCGALAREWLNGWGGRQALPNLAQADERIGTAAQELGLLPEALRAFDEGQQLLDQLLIAEPRNPVLLRRRALLDHYRSQTYFNDSGPSLDSPAPALESAQRYLTRAREMAASDPNNTSAQFSRAVAMFQVSFCLREFDPMAAATIAHDSVRQFDELLASGKASYLVTSRRIRAEVRWGEAELKANHRREALRIAELVLAEQRPLAGKQVSEFNEHEMLVSALLLAGQANAALGRSERAETLLHEARVEAQLLVRGEAVENIMPLARVERVLGDFYAQRGRTSEARECAQNVVALWQRFPEPNFYIDRQKASAKRWLTSLHS